MIKKNRKILLSLISIAIFLTTMLGLTGIASATINWSDKAPMPTGRYDFATIVLDGKIYAIGGMDTIDSSSTIPATPPVSIVEVYDTTTNSWSTVAPMPTARAALVAEAVNGKIYAIGGYGVAGNLSTVEEYDPVSNTWVTKQSMPTARANLASAVVNGRIYAIGGEDVTIDPVATVEEYDPVLNTWTAKTDMPTSRFGLTAQAVGGKIYAIGGEQWDLNAVPPNAYSLALDTVEEYDPISNSWTGKTPNPSKAGWWASAVVNDAIYTFAGFDTSEQVSMLPVEVYYPSIDGWGQETSITVKRLVAGGAAVNGKLFIMGGINPDDEIIRDSVEEGIIGVSSGSGQVTVNINPSLELYLNPANLVFNGVNPITSSYQQTRIATVRSNRNWELSVKKLGDLTGSIYGDVIPSSQLTFTSPTQSTPVEFLTNDTLVDSGGPTVGSNTTINYSLTVNWDDTADDYSADHIYTVVQP